MGSDYARISADNTVNYGTHVETYGKLLADRLYSDRTHFVFELLQNAEDVAATEVHFELSRDRLLVRHNGRLFTEANVRAICGLADGTKSEDLTKIGTFGIGFKSVYGYTHAPEIHSGDEHFRIVRYVHPEPVPALPLAMGETCFVFPFDKADVPADGAYRQIKERLMSLGGQTLLFLRHIRRISWRCADGHSGRYGREVLHEGRPRQVQVWEERGAERHTTAYMMFDRPVRNEEVAGSLKVEIAFRLQRDAKTGQTAVAPEEAARLVVFFPTEKPVPMKFLIQGPYRTTPARDNVPTDDPWNRQLIEETARLLVEVLPHIKATGLLTAGFLATLPLQPSEPMYEPLADAVREALRTEAYLPAHEGGHVSAPQARLASSAALRDLFGDGLLAELSGIPGARWVTGQITPDRTPELWQYLRKTLELEEVKPAALVAEMDGAFFQARDDGWMARFYAFLDGHDELWRWRTLAAPVLQNEAYIRTEDGRHVAPFVANMVRNVWLPPEGETDFPVVRRAIAADEGAMKFFKNLGLNLPNPLDEVIRSVLPKYEPARLAAMTREEHERDVSRVLGALEALTLQERGRIIQLMGGLPFFLAQNAATGRLELKKAIQIYTRTPELEAYFEANPDVWFYADHEKLASLAKEMGAGSRIRRLPRQVGEGPADGEDYDFDGLGFFLDRLGAMPQALSAARAAFLWQTLSGILQLMSFKSREEFFTAKVKPARKRARLVEEEASFLKLLKARQWLPGPQGALCRPDEVSLGDLPAAFVRDEWLARKLGLRPDAVAQLAESLGTSPEDISEFLRHREAFKQWMHQQERSRPAPRPAEPTPPTVAAVVKPAAPPRPVERQAPPSARPAPALPTSRAPDAVRRAEKASEKVDAAEDKRYAESRVMRRVTAGAAEAKAYLVHHHTNVDGHVICQLCDGYMPFKLNGTDHFEAIQFLESYGKEYEANYLALCPNCAAEYRFACATPEAVKVARVLALKDHPEESDLLVALELPVHDRLRFTQRHLIDLAAAMQSHEPAPV